MNMQPNYLKADALAEERQIRLRYLQRKALSSLNYYLLWPAILFLLAGTVTGIWLVVANGR